MSTRLFHTVILVGTALGASFASASCGGSVSSADCQGATCAPADGGGGDAPDAWPSIGIGYDSGSDGWHGIRPADCDAAPSGPGCAKDSGADAAGDTGVDTFPSIAADSGMDTWLSITPFVDAGVDSWPVITPFVDAGVDTWPGISPPPPPDGGHV